MKPSTKPRRDWRELFIENSHDAVAGINGQSIIIDWNHQAEKIFGWEKEYAIGRKISELIIPSEFHQAHFKGIQHFLQTGEGPILNKHVELEALHVSGKRIPIELTVSPIEAEGEILFYAFIRDLTERKIIDALKDEQRKQLSAMFQDAPAAICIRKGEDMTIELANRNYLKLLGRTAEQMIGKKTDDVFPEYKDHYLRTNLDDVYHSGQIYEGHEIPFHYPDGSQGYFDFINQPLFNPQRQVEGVVTFATDVTTSIEARKKVELSENRLRLIIDACPAFIALLDRDVRYQFVNSQYEQVFKLERKQIEGMHARDLLGEELYEKFKIHHEKALNGEATHVDTSLLLGDRIRYLDIQYLPYREDNKIKGLLVVGLEISELKKTEVALREALKARDEFISICSHELKTPITSMKMQFQMAKKLIDRDDPKVYDKDIVHKRVTIANTQLERMALLIDDMLEASRIAMGKLHIEKKPLEINELATEVLDRFSEQLNILNLKVDLHKEDRPVMVFGDKFRLEQVISNLITNAMKYGKHKPFSISITTQDERVLISVKDRGLGIAPEKLPAIFSRFERAVEDSGISGLGLGLYISQQIVLSHDGIIRVESELDQGSVFTVELPLLSEA
jgi:PAS domain S-box-containing protein